MIGVDQSDDEDATTVHGCDDEEDYEDLLPLETELLPEASTKAVGLALCSTFFSEFTKGKYEEFIWPLKWKIY